MFTSNLIHLFPTTSNKYEVLSNLNEDEFTGATFKDGEVQI
jgi:hypothetical protein